MGIKRPLMILGSTVGAVAAVLSYHPAANSSTALLTPTPEAPVDAAVNPPAASASPTATATSTPSATPTPAATPTQSAQPTAQPSATTAKKSSKAKSATKKSSTTKTSSGSASSANATTSPSDTTQSTTTSEPSAAPSTPATPTPKAAKDQTVTGATAQTRWGPVQVQITVKDGKIVDAVGVQYPNGDRRSLWISQQAIPWLVEETLSEQIANVQNIGGATYTTNGWRQSLASAMQKAGL
jgi:uncharacterized protein with FMN-binding domain